MRKRLVIFFLFLLVIPIAFSVQTNINFYEDWGTTTWYRYYGHPYTFENYGNDRSIKVDRTAYDAVPLQANTSFLDLNFNNEWRLFTTNAVQDWVRSVNASNVTTWYKNNTKVGLNIGSGNVGFIVIATELNTPVYFADDTEFSYYFAYATEEQAQYDLCFYSQTDDITFCIVLADDGAGGSNECGGLKETDNSSTYCIEAPMEEDEAHQSFTYYNWTMGNVSAYAALGDFDDGYDNLTKEHPNTIFDYMYLKFYSAGNTVFDDLTIINLKNGTNELPVFNVTFEETYRCIEYNETFPQSIDLVLDVYDPEGGVIYYGTSTYATNYSSFFDFTKNYCVFRGFSYYTDYDLLGENLDLYIPPVCYGYSNVNDIYDYFVANKTDTCIIKPYHDSYIDEYHYLEKRQNALGEESIQLVLNSDCTGTDKSVLFDSETNSYSGNVEFEVNGLEIGDILNLTLLDNEFQDNYLHLNFYRNNSQFYIEASNGTIINNFSTSSESYRIKLSNTYDNQDNFYIEVRYITGITLDTIFEDTFQYGDTDKDEFKYVKYGIDDGDDISIDYMFYTLQKMSIIWGTQQPNNVTRYYSGYSHHFFYVTDDYHYPDEYAEKDYWIRIEQKEHCFDVDTEDIDAIVDVLGNPLRSFLNYQGITNEMKTMLYVLFFFLFVVFNVMHYKSNGTINLALSGLLSSFISFILAYTLKFSIQMVVFLITFTLSLVILVLTKNE